MGVEQAERRAGYRLPVAPSDGLSASISYGVTKCRAIVRDISLSGMLLQLDMAPAPAQGDSVSVELVLGQKRAVLDGIVRRSAEGRVGISFPSAFKDGRLDPPLPLLDIYYGVFSAWHSRKIEEYQT